MSNKLFTTETGVRKEEDRVLIAGYSVDDVRTIVAASADITHAKPGVEGPWCCISTVALLLTGRHAGPAAARALAAARLEPLDPALRRAEVLRLMAAHGVRPQLGARAWRLTLLGVTATCKATPEGAIDGWAWAVILAARGGRRRAAA